MIREKILPARDIYLILHSVMEVNVATIGFFDGVHLGHRCLIEQVNTVAKQIGGHSMAVTFDKHPRKVLSSDYQPFLLTSFEEKLALLKASGVDRVEVLSFTKELSLLTAQDFMRHVLYADLGVRVLLMGYDHMFGHGGGTFSEYVDWGRQAGIEVLRAKELGDMHVSSSRIRYCVENGDMAGANKLLGHPFVIEGEVVKGRQVGRKIGFPTANIVTEQDKLLPPVGVYAVRVELPDGIPACGMMCVGDRPTLHNGNDITVEVHIFDFDGNLYGRYLRIMPVEKFRDERCFPSVKDLCCQLQTDEAEARQLLDIQL